MSGVIKQLRIHKLLRTIATTFKFSQSLSAWLGIVINGVIPVARITGGVAISLTLCLNVHGDGVLCTLGGASQ